MSRIPTSNVGLYPRIPKGRNAYDKACIMDEIKAEETLEESEPTLENQEENTEEEGTPPVEEEKPSEDADFEKELETLEQKPKRTELERAVHTREQIDKRIVDLGGESVIRPKKEVSEFVTKDDFAEQYARTLGKTESEIRVIMWHYKNGIQRSGNIHEDIDNAYWLAHKGRIRRTYQEIDRIQRPPQGGGGAGQKLKDKPSIPAMSPEEQLAYQRRGFKLNSQTGEWEAKFNKAVFDQKTRQWITVRK